MQDTPVIPTASLGACQIPECVCECFTEHAWVKGRCVCFHGAETHHAGSKLLLHSYTTSRLNIVSGDLTKNASTKSTILPLKTSFTSTPSSLNLGSSINAFSHKSQNSTASLVSIEQEDFDLFQLRGFEKEAITIVSDGLERLNHLSTFLNALALTEKQFYEGIVALDPVKLSLEKDIVFSKMYQRVSSQAFLHEELAAEIEALSYETADIAKQLQIRVCAITERYSILCVEYNEAKTDVARLYEICDKLVIDKDKKAKRKRSSMFAGRSGKRDSAASQKLQTSVKQYDSAIALANSISKKNWNIEFPSLHEELRNIELSRIEKTLYISNLYSEIFSRLPHSFVGISGEDIIGETSLSTLANSLTELRKMDLFEWELCIPLAEALTGVSRLVLPEFDTETVIPKSVLAFIAAFKSHEGLSTEGIFRVAGDFAEVELIFRAMLSGDFAFLDESAVNDIAGAFKRWIREFFQPLIPGRFVDLVREVCYDHDRTLDTQACGERLLLEVLLEIPEKKYLMVCGLIGLLQEVRRNSEVNKMTHDNLATVFGPTFVYDFTLNDPLAMFELSKLGAKVVLILLDTLDCSPFDDAVAAMG